MKECALDKVDLGVLLLLIRNRFVVNSGIYKIRNTINENVYIGSAVDLDGRWKGHIYDLRHKKYPHCHLQRAYNKYGEDAFEFKVLERCAKEDLTGGKKREQYWINKYKRLVGWDNMYNKSPTAGSCFGYKHTIQAKENMSKAKKRKNLSLETRVKISESKKGERNPMWGKHPSLETLAKMSKAHKCENLSPETRANISKAQCGKKSSPETRAKMSKAQRIRWGIRHREQTVSYSKGLQTKRKDQQ
jgi:group I intron endonuclease